MRKARFVYFMPQRVRAAWLVGALALGCVGQAQAASAIKVPSDGNFPRFQLLDKPDRDNQQGKMKVYVLMLGEVGNEKLLISSSAQLAKISVGDVHRRLTDAIKATERFDVYDHVMTGGMDQSSIVVEAKVVAATQHVENLIALRKAFTRVDLSVQIKDMQTGQLLRAKTFTGRYGEVSGEGTTFNLPSDANRPEAQESLFKDYQRALGEALADAATYIEKRYRPVGRISELKGKRFAMDGGSLHGFNEDDKVVIFRTQFSTRNGVRVPGLQEGLAQATCETVTEFTSTCEISAQVDTPVQAGDYVILSDESLNR